MAEALWAVVLLAALAGAQLLARDLRTVPTGSVRRGPAPVSVVVPARDEEATLPELLEALGRSAVAPAEVLVVDDGSRDATAAVAAAGGARVVDPGSPPPGWTGKAWACHVGARETTGDLLLFLDADTVLAPGALGGLLELRERHGGLVSVQPHHTAVRAYEQLSAYFNAVAVLASAAFAHRPGTPPLAFGPCLLTSRADLERAGGHAAVRGAVLDDVELAAAYHHAGLPVHCAVGGDAVRMRSYPGGWRQLVRGWSKNIASGASAATPRGSLLTGVWVAAHHAVAAGAVLAAVGAGAAHPVLWLVAWVAVAAQLRWLLRRVGSFRWWTWALFPVPLLAFDAVFARSAVDTVGRRSVRWRGREVDLRRGAPGGGG